MIPSLYIGNGCLVKHPLKTGWVQSSKNIRGLSFLDFRDVVRKQQNPRFVFFNGKFLIAQSRMFIFHSWDFQLPILKNISKPLPTVSPGSATEAFAVSYSNFLSTFALIFPNAFRAFLIQYPSSCNLERELANDHNEWFHFGYCIAFPKWIVCIMRRRKIFLRMGRLQAFMGEVLAERFTSFQNRLEALGTGLTSRMLQTNMFSLSTCCWKASSLFFKGNLDGSDVPVWRSRTWAKNLNTAQHMMRIFSAVLLLPELGLLVIWMTLSWSCL